MSAFTRETLAGVVVVARLIGADMNSTADQSFTWLRRPRRWRFNAFFVANPSVAFSNALGGVYTAASKGGTALLPSNTGYTGLTGPTALVGLNSGSPSSSVSANVLSASLVTSANCSRSRSANCCAATT